MRDIFPSWYVSPLQPQVVIEIVIADWAVKQLINFDYLRDFDWTASIYRDQPICKHEIEYGLPPEEDIKGFILDTRSLIGRLARAYYGGATAVSSQTSQTEVSL